MLTTLWPLPRPGCSMIFRRPALSRASPPPRPPAQAAVRFGRASDEPAESGDARGDPEKGPPDSLLAFCMRHSGALPAAGSATRAYRRAVPKAAPWRRPMQRSRASRALRRACRGAGRWRAPGAARRPGFGPAAAPEAPPRRPGHSRPTAQPACLFCTQRQAASRFSSDPSHSRAAGAARLPVPPSPLRAVFAVGRRAGGRGAAGRRADSSSPLRPADSAPGRPGSVGRDAAAPPQFITAPSAAPPCRPSPRTPR